MPGSDYLVGSVKNAEKTLSGYTIAFVVLGSVGWCCYTFLIEENRNRFLDRFRNMCSGKLVQHDDDDDNHLETW